MQGLLISIKSPKGTRIKSDRELLYNGTKLMSTGIKGLRLKGKT